MELLVSQAEPGDKGAKVETAASVTPGATVIAGWRRMPRTAGASSLRMRCCRSSRANVASRRRAAWAGVGASAHSARTHSAVTSSLNARSWG